MRLWRWYRARRRRWQVLIALLGLPLAAAALYVSARSLQYLGAERDAGLYIPSGANLVVRARRFESQWERIRATVAWRAIERRILRDRATRRTINAALKDARLPTLDDLEDERKAGALSPERLRWILGYDTVAAARVGATWNDVKACAVVRLPWSVYLVSPLARWVYPAEAVGGHAALRVRRGKVDLFVHFAGSLALVSNDRALLEQALRRQGTAEGGTRPVEIRAKFDNSPALLDLRRAFQTSGLFPHVRFETARAVEVTGDLSEAALMLDALIEGAQPARVDPAPHAFLRGVPAHASGVLVTQAGVHELYQWLRSLVRPGASDLASKNAQQALDTLDGVGKFSSTFLPLVDSGMALVTGGEAGEGRVYPAVAMVFPTRHAPEAVEAMDALVKKIAGKTGEGDKTFGFRTEPVEDTVMHWWKWPGGLQISDFATPCYAALKDAFILGNNERFTEAVIRAFSTGAGSLPEQSHYRALVREMRKRGIAPDPDLAGGFVALPALRASLDGLLPHAARFMVDSTVDRVALRAEVDEEFRRLGTPTSPGDVVRRFNEIIDAKARDQEDLLRANLVVLESMKWCAFESRRTEKGISFRWALEFR
jgi:hypothetical protein